VTRTNGQDGAAVQEEAVSGRNGAPENAPRLTLELTQTILARRAEALAARPMVAPADALETLVFALGQERYALVTDQVIEVRSAASITALPRTPAFVAGLTNVRGKVVPVLDLRPLFGVHASDESPQTVVLLHSPRGAVGLLASGQPEVHRLRTTDLSGLPAGSPAGLAADYVRGVTPDLIILLDGERLLADPRIMVGDE